MIKLFNPGNYPSKISIALLLLRVTAGILMLTHGWGKFLKLTNGGPIEFADPLGIGATASLVLTVFSEVFCSIFLILGFATRLSAIPLLITMFIAAFVVHVNDGFGKMELALFYAVVYLVILITGAGKFSVDQWIYSRFNSSGKSPQ